MELQDKNIVITGASKGLGRKTSLLLSKSKSNLILIARTKSLLEQLKNEIEEQTGKAPLIIACDITNENEINSMAEIVRAKFSHIDVLVNNAGIGIHKDSQLLSNEEMRKQFEVNFYGSFYCIKALFPLLKKSSCGYILNVGSLVSKIAFADNSVYAATKFALAGFTQGLYYEMKKYKIKVGHFLPGIMDTSFQNDRETSKTPSFLVITPEKAAKEIESMIKNRKKSVYMYKWMLVPMRIKQFLSNFTD